MYKANLSIIISLGVLVLSFLFFSCTGNHWQNKGDSCVQISEKPPLRRVINYTDHDLCERKLSPRKAPNPQTRPNNFKD